MSAPAARNSVGIIHIDHEVGDFSGLVLALACRLQNAQQAIDSE
jgi:hypothetical protein